MPFRALSENVNITGKKAEEFLRTTAEYHKLRLFKSSMKFATSLVDMLVIGSLFLLFLAFFSVGISLWIGSGIGNLQGGFFIVGAFYLALCILAAVFGKKLIVKAILSKFSGLIKEEGGAKVTEITRQHEIDDVKEPADTPIAHE